MNKEFIPYEESLALRELGFDEKCLGYFNDKGVFCYSSDPWNATKEKGMMYNPTSAPLYQQAFRWFRDKYKLLHEIRTYNEGSWLLTIYSISSKTKHGVYNGNRWEFENDENYVDPNSYEEAELACLKKLIEIVKK